MKDLTRRLNVIRAAHPKASVLYALILIYIGTRRVSQQDIIREFQEDPNDSTVPGILKVMEGLGLVCVDRSSPTEGNTVRLSD